MLQQADNSVFIEGILNEIDLDPNATYKNKVTGKTVECIRGKIIVRVDTVVNGQQIVCYIPIPVFQNKYKKDGTPNQAYDSVKSVLTMNSVAAVGENEADGIRVSGASLSTNSYVSKRTGKVVTYPSIRASFFNKRDRTSLKPTAEFNCVCVVANQGYITDKDGIETDKYKVKGIVPGWGGNIDVFDFVTTNKDAIDFISTNWSNGDTVSVNGRLNFTSTTKVEKIPQDFGEPIERTRTINVSDLVITSGSQPTAGYDMDEINEALAERKAKMDQMEADSKKEAATPPAQRAATDFSNFGF